MCFTFHRSFSSLPQLGCPAGRRFDGQSEAGQGAREPSARTGPDANILSQDQYAARGRLYSAAMEAAAEEDPM